MAFYHAFRTDTIDPAEGSQPAEEESRQAPAGDLTIFQVASSIISMSERGSTQRRPTKPVSSDPTAGKFHRSLVKMLDEMTPEEFDRRRKQAEEEEDRAMGRRR
jgi:hypothetical protein